jgi:hypothetical protein
MTVFFKIWPGIFKKTVITLQALRFKLKCLNQTCISLKSSMQFARTIFSDSASFIEKKRVENRCGQKVNFRGQKKLNHVKNALYDSAPNGPNAWDLEGLTDAVRLPVNPVTSVRKSQSLNG